MRLSYRARIRRSGRRRPRGRGCWQSPPGCRWRWGVSLACVIERLRGGFSLPEQVEAALGLPLIGLVPKVPPSVLRRQRGGRQAIVLNASLDRFRGQMRVLGEARPRLIMVTSALPKEGKSIFAGELARNTAAAGWRVLLLECDFGCPSLSRQFGLRAGPGLCEILSGGILGSTESVMHHPEPHLNVITAGRVSGDPQELLASKRMSALLTAVRSQYDLVILDTPPVLPVADALVLARQADATVAVVRWEKTPRLAASDAIRLLRESGARIMGVAMTQVDLRTAAISGGPHVLCLQPLRRLPRRPGLIADAHHHPRHGAGAAEPAVGDQPGSAAAARPRLRGVRGGCGPGDRRQLRPAASHGPGAAVHRLYRRAVRAGHAVPPRRGWFCRRWSPLFGLLGYALLSVMILPQAFEGQVMVWPQRPDALNPSFVPLSFNSGNVTQPMYLTMNVVVATCTALLVTRSAIPYRSIMRAYLLGGYVAVGIAFWQFASRIAGIPFPDDVLYSNPGWAIVKQVIARFRGFRDRFRSLRASPFISPDSASAACG